jgi:phosphate transport system substrate-binding protein
MEARGAVRSEGLRRRRVRPVMLLMTLGLLVSLSAGISAAQDATPITVAPYVPPDGLGSVGGTIRIDGSSTVFPIVDEARLQFEEFAGEVEVRVEFSGTGGGFERFCAGEIEIAAASRPITADETAACAEGGVRYYAYPIAYDGVTIVVHPSKDFVACLTVDQLRLLWRPDDPATTWQDLDPSWPDEEIALYGPGQASGTFDFFTGTILGESGVSRLDYFPSEDDNVLVAAVADDEDALGYFGYAYYQDEAHRDALKAVAIDAGQGCVLPAPETIASGAYQPLSRPLYLYVRAESLASSTVLEFVRFTLASARDIVPLVGYVPLPDADYAAQQARLEAATVGNAAPDGP